MQRPAKPRTPVRFRPQPPVIAQVAKQVDARDLKSLGGNTMPVRFRPWAPYKLYLCAIASGVLLPQMPLLVLLIDRYESSNGSYVFLIDFLAFVSYRIPTRGQKNMGYNSLQQYTTLIQDFG